MRTLVLGGTRSGKSARAESLLAGPSHVRYLATGAVPTGDDQAWSERVQAHRDRRGARYTTVESLDLAGLLRADPDAATLVDDLGNWVTGLLDAADAWDDEAVDLAAEITELRDAVAEFRGQLVIVSPEVGLSVVPATATGRRFQDLLGAVNAAVAGACENVELVVAGRILAPLPADRTALPADRTALPDDRAETRSPARNPEPEELGRSERPQGSVKAPKIPETAARRELDPTDAEVFEVVDLPDEDVAESARRRLLTLTKPPNSLGRLEDIGVWISSCQGVCPPKAIRSPQIVVFAGDHGVAREGVSAFPPEVTAQMVTNIAEGGAAINVLARRAGAAVQVLDMSVDSDDADPVVARYKVRRSTGDLRRGEAMTLAEARRAVAAGRAVADDLVDAGADLLIAGDMGIGNTTPAAVLTGTITGKEPVVVVGRGTGVDDAGWIRKTAAIRDGLRFGRRHRHDPLSLLAAVAGPDLAAMAGFLAQAALRKTPVILDGMVVTSAALVANSLAPGASAWWCAGHRSTEPAHGFALAELGLEPILDLSMRLGEGSGAATALPVVADAVDILIDMATFGDAGVDDGS
ncbi:nicotinate-nucleotide--dimethylbenzimidazole phosphoribosyltransferase [Gordonia caeni]|uniref:Nicotinate-nucleotide--dimethylbenzimidazole phosphoribosyltransferase n=1 Tax=Gordonia caeni TaxID=1007097 RepID=A0ABP7PD95_9ACTN